MNITLDMTLLFQGLVLGMLGAGIRGIFNMNKKLNDMNGSIREVRTWATGHETLDSQRHATLDKNVTELWKQFNIPGTGARDG